MDEQFEAHPEGHDAEHSRRTFFSRTAMAAAAAAVTGVAIAHEAQAANGDTMFVGSSNTATSSTTISGGSSFVVTGGSSNVVHGYATSISGVTTTGTGVAGTSTVGIGVLATTDGGIGLQAEANSSFGSAIQAQALGEQATGVGVYVAGTSARGMTAISDGDNAVAVYGWHFGPATPVRVWSGSPIPASAWSGPDRRSTSMPTGRGGSC